MAFVTAEFYKRRLAEEIEQQSGGMIFESLQQLAQDLGLRLVAKEYPDEPEDKVIIWLGFGSFYGPGGDVQIGKGPNVESATENAISYLKAEFTQKDTDSE